MQTAVCAAWHAQHLRAASCTHPTPAALTQCDSWYNCMSWVMFELFQYDKRPALRGFLPPLRPSAAAANPPAAPPRPAPHVQAAKAHTCGSSIVQRRRAVTRAR